MFVKKTRFCVLPLKITPIWSSYCFLRISQGISQGYWLMWVRKSITSSFWTACSEHDWWSCGRFNYSVSDAIHEVIFIDICMIWKFFVIWCQRFVVNNDVSFVSDRWKYQENESVIKLCGPGTCWEYNDQVPCIIFRPIQ